MKRTVKIKPGGENNGYIPVDLYLSKTGKKTIVFIGGSGDDRHVWDTIINALQKQPPELNFVSFSFSGMEAGETYSLRQQVLDLTAVLDYLVNELKLENLITLSTSMGAVCNCIVMGLSKYADHVKQVILLDPADYNLFPDLYSQTDHTWDGASEFKPQGNLASDFLPLLPKHTKVDVIHFTLKNCSKDHDYIAQKPKDRGLDHPDGYPRLNTQMVKNFYFQTPQNSRGQYLEVPGIPHAFNNYGDTIKNNNEIVKLLGKLI